MFREFMRWLDHLSKDELIGALWVVLIFLLGLLFGFGMGKI